MTQRRAPHKQKAANAEAVLVDDSVFNEHAFRELVQHVQLRDVFLRETRAALDAVSDQAETGKGELVIRPTQTRAQIGDKALLYCGVRFEITAEDSPEFPFCVTVFAEYGLFYDIPQALVVNKATASVFARRNAVFNAWPFFRELVHSTAGRMGAPSLVMPTFRLPVTPP